MATEIKVPSLGESISSGILAAWHVEDGDTVEQGQTIYELETDKITTEGNAEASGQITLKVEVGDEVDVGQVIAEIDESAAGDQKEEKKEAKDESPAKEEKDTGAGQEAAEKPEGEEEKPAAGQAPAGKQTTEPAKSDEPGEAAARDLQGLPPAVRRIAAEEGIDPANVEGTGKGGRVTKGDMLAAVEARQRRQAEPSPAREEEPEEQTTPPTQAPAASKETAPTREPDKRTTRRKMTPLRRRIAERLVQASQEAALLTTFNEVDMSAVMGIRKKYQDDFVAKHEIKLGFMSFFVKAAVQALKAVPQVNAQIDGNEVIENHYYDIGVAVGTDRGLVVPVVRHCDAESFAGIERQIAGYAKKAREGKIEISDLEGGVFTISNGGIYGSMLSTPIVNPPQSGILGLHNIQQRPTVVNGEVVARPMMYLALTYDHRLVDGKEAVTFLVKIKECIEDPARMLFEM